MERRITVAAIAGDLDWSYRKSCSNQTYDAGVANAYIREYTSRNCSRVAQAAGMGANIVVGQEYFRGSELFITDVDAKRTIVEAPDGATSTELGNISAKYKTSICCSYECDLGSHIHETGILTADDGTLKGVHPKHPRSVPAPSNWPYNTGVRIYDLGDCNAGISVCSDLTYDPRLPLDMADAGMEILLLPGCGFMNSLWKHFIVVRAIDTGAPVVYADDRRAAIVDSDGSIVAMCEGSSDVIVGEVTLNGPSYLSGAR